MLANITRDAVQDGTDHSTSAFDTGAKYFISLWDTAGVLRRGWIYLFLGCCLGMAAAFTYVQVVPTLYKSTSRILIDKSSNRFLQANKILDEPILDDGDVGSQIYILTSESIILKVVNLLDLTRDPEFVGKEPQAQVDSQSFTAKLKSIVKAMIGQHQSENIDQRTKLERKAVDTFEKQLNVSRADIPSVIEVSFSSEDPKKAATTANALVDAYLESSLTAKLASTQMANRLLQNRLLELKLKVTEADDQLHTYKLANGVVDDNKNPLKRDQVQGLNSLLTTARVNVADAKARLDRLKQQIDREGSPGAAIPDNDVVKRLRQQYLDLVEREADLRPRVGETHEAVRKLRSRMRELELAMRQEAQRQADTYDNDYSLALARESEIFATLNKASAEANSTSQAQVPLKELEQSSESLHALYNSVQQKFNELNKAQTEAMLPQEARVITRAAPSLAKSVKKPLLILAGGTMLGLLLGAAFVLARELLPAGFRSSDQVKQATGLYCVNVVTADLGGAAKHPQKLSAEPLGHVLKAPFSRFTEAFRHITAQVQQSNRASGDKVFCVVSSLAGEGKTLVTGNLGALLSQLGNRTLIIDCDLHRSTLTRLLVPNASSGLIEALRQPSRLSDFVYAHPELRADILPCVLPHRDCRSIDLLGSDDMGLLVKHARGAYDYVIFDAPPIMPVTDVRLFERFVDKFVFVVQWNTTSRRVVLESLGESAAIYDRILCIALNNVLPDALRYIEAYKGSKFNLHYVG